METPKPPWKLHLLNDEPSVSWPLSRTPPSLLEPSRTNTNCTPLPGRESCPATTRPSLSRIVPLANRSVVPVRICKVAVAGTRMSWPTSMIPGPIM